MKLELISFHLCPFVQRSVITLKEKGAEYDVTYIDLATKPDWFLRTSPEGKVPVLRVDDEHIIFESAVINEFVNEVTPGDLHPSDPVTKAHNRAWIAFGEKLLFDQHEILSAANTGAVEEAWTRAEARLQRVAASWTGPFFNGDELSLVDAAYAPLLQRFAIATRYMDLPGYTDIPALGDWWTHLAQRPAVQDSVPADFEDALRAYFRGKDSHFGRHC